MKVQNDRPHLLRSYPGMFFLGAVVGIFISIVFGLATYPWARPGFEGGRGCHMLMMIVVTPLLTAGASLMGLAVAGLIRWREKNKTDK